MSFTAYLFPTHRCNLKCAHCYATGARRAFGGDLPLDLLLRAIDGLTELGVTDFDISGGEPTLYAPLPAVCERIRSRRGGRTWLVSNGTGLDRQMLDSIAGCVDRLAISIDGPTSERHDARRGVPGSFDQAVRAVSAAKQAGVSDVCINHLLCAESASEVVDMLELGAGAGADRIALLIPRDVAELTVFYHVMLSKRALVDAWTSVAQFLASHPRPRVVNVVTPSFLMKEAQSFKRTLGEDLQDRMEFQYPNLRGMSAFRTTVVVKATGAVTGDTAMLNDPEFEIGDLRTDEIGAIWRRGAGRWRDVLKDREQRLRDQAPCSSCDRWAVCRGGCVAAAKRQWGDMWKHDRTCDGFRAEGSL